MMDTTEKILKYYSSENPGVKANLRRILASGDLANTGKMMILAVDQGIEHGPDISFFSNPQAYDPLYHHIMAVAYGYNAYAAPLGALKHSADLSGLIPTILKINSSNLLFPKDMEPNQSVTATVDAALILGCSAIGFTIYPGSENMHLLINQFAPIAEYARNCGLASVVWSYARGKDLKKEYETAVDVIGYAAHIAAQIGAHIIKVKIPNTTIWNESLRDKLCQGALFETSDNICQISGRISEIMRACFNGERIVIFSGGMIKDEQDLLEEAMAIKRGGGYGSIIGRNIFQRPMEDAARVSCALKYIYSHDSSDNFVLEDNEDEIYNMTDKIRYLFEVYGNKKLK